MSTRTYDEWAAIRDRIFPIVREKTLLYPTIPRQYTAIYPESFVGTKANDPLIIRHEVDRGCVCGHHHQIGRPVSAGPVDDADVAIACEGLMESVIHANEVSAVAFLSLDLGFWRRLRAEGVDDRVGGNRFRVSLSGGDREPFFSSRRGNAPENPVALDVNGLLSAFVKIRAMDGVAKTLLIPPELEPMAIRLLDPEMPEPRQFPGKSYQALDYLDVDMGEHWFLLTGIPGFERRIIEPFEMSVKVTAEEDGVLIEAHETVEWICHDPRAIWSSGHT